MQLLVEEFLDLWPRFVPGVREVRCNPVINFIDVLGLHDGRQGGLLVRDLDFEDLLCVLFGFLLLRLLLGLHFVYGGMSVYLWVISFIIVIMIDVRP